MTTRHHLLSSKARVSSKKAKNHAISDTKNKKLFFLSETAYLKLKYSFFNEHQRIAHLAKMSTPALTLRYIFDVIGRRPEQSQCGAEKNGQSAVLSFRFFQNKILYFPGRRVSLFGVSPGKFVYIGRITRNGIKLIQNIHIIFQIENIGHSRFQKGG